jgi:hypothetical protein
VARIDQQGRTSLDFNEMGESQKHLPLQE